MKSPEEYLKIISKYYDISNIKLHKLIAIRNIFVAAFNGVSDFVNYVHYINKDGKFRYFMVYDEILDKDEKYVIFENMNIDIVSNGEVFNVAYYNPIEENSIVLYWYINEFNDVSLSGRRFRSKDITTSYTRRNFEIIDEL